MRGKGEGGSRAGKGKRWGERVRVNKGRGWATAGGRAAGKLGASWTRLKGKRSRRGGIGGCEGGRRERVVWGSGGRRGGEL